ncbi:MAG: hypothetical protein ACLQU5_13635 [Isosphaeraceae bacterium]
MEEAPQPRLVVPARLQLSKDFLVELVSVLWRDIAQPIILQALPQRLHPHPLLGMGGPVLDVRPHPGLFHQFADQAAVWSEPRAGHGAIRREAESPVRVGQNAGIADGEGRRRSS